MRNIFYRSLSLLSLPDISKLNTNKVTDISKIFYVYINYLNTQR